jgi:hypothetical protein
MLKSVLKLGAVALLAAAIAGTPAQLLAQTTNTPAAEKKPATSKKESKPKEAHPFHGKLAAVDTTAKTITIGQSVYLITSATKITKSGKPATLADAVVGEKVSGHAKPGDDGKMVATSLKLGEEKADKKKKE